MPTYAQRPWLYRSTIILAVLTLIAFLAVNTIGFVDTETGSQFGCGHQWPLCNGAVIPQHWGIKTIIEFSHRGLVALATILLLALCAMVWVQYRKWIEVKVLMAFAIGFVFLEAALGALGVIFGDQPIELAFHFGVSLVAFNAILLLTLIIRYIRRSIERNPAAPSLRGETPRKLRVWTWVAVIYTYVAMYIGAYVASTGDGHLFRGWPIPLESPSVGPAFAVDWLHRTVALGLLVLSVYLAILAGRIRTRRPDLFFGSLTLVVLVCIQALSGALLLATNFTLFSFLIHVTVVTFLFAAVCYLAMQALPEPTRRWNAGGSSRSNETGYPTPGKGQPGHAGN